jgi:hypothetical protein
MYYEIWKFETERFTIVATAETEYDPDLSWDETGEVTEKIEAGEWELFCAKVADVLDGREIATDYLGNCVYVSADDFARGHRDPDPMNRNCSAMRAARGNVSICHYFPGMVSEAVAYARNYLKDNPAPKIRAV